mmetsp:Transcript_4547/g.11259  ORF Transcript_4547/g.11259 Transcript_4547/m.11259 type:complete len:613 (-) Transcript_4547:2242-4080(-)
MLTKRCAQFRVGPSFVPTHSSHGVVRQCSSGIVSSTGGALGSRVQHVNVLAKAPHSATPACGRGRAAVRASAAAVDAVTSPQSDAAGTGINWLDAWYPVAFVADIDKAAPYKFELMGIPLVIWWEPASSGAAPAASAAPEGGAWRVLEDLCPHRLVPLSEGRVNRRGRLECGYHGWEFVGSGACVNIPQGGNASSRRACVTAYPCAVRQGLLWVQPRPLPAGSDPATAQVDTAAIPIVPELEDPAWVPMDAWRDTPYDATLLLENVIDSSHVPFTHHKSISNRNKIGDYKLRLTSPVTAAGFTGDWPTGPRAGQLGPQSTRFVAPCFMVHTLDASAQRGFKSLTVVYATPMGPGRCRLINRNCTRFDKSQLPAKIIRSLPPWASHVGSHVPLEDDQIFLHVGELHNLRRRAGGASATSTGFLGSPADTLVAAYRSWLDRFGGGGPFGRPSEALLALLPPRQSREQLLDRWSQHTQQCATCQRGMRQISGVSNVANTVASVALGATLLTAAVAVTGASGLAVTAAASGSTVTSAAAAAGTSTSVSTLAASAGTALLKVLAAVAGSGPPTAQVLRALAWALLAACAKYVASAADGYLLKFRRGDYPPMRNTATD